MDLKGVLVDFGYTLAYVDEGGDMKYREEIVSILKKFGHNRTLDELSPLLDSAYRSSTKGEVGDMYEFWKLLLKSMEIPEKPRLIQKLEELRKRYMTTSIRLYGNVIPVLSDLKNKYKLALVSNCAIGLSDVINALGLNRFFECIILSYEVKVRKPDRHIYLEALQRLNLKPEECIFVADEISDLEGASEIGLKTFLVRQGPHTTRETKDPNFKPDFQCNNISEITKFL